MTMINDDNKHAATTPQTITIRVNNRDVKMPNRSATGRQIKDAAIAHGVPIEAGFKLFRVTGGTQHSVGDAEEVKLHDGQEFRCVAPDDNS